MSAAASRVLLVDDDPAVLKALSRLLRSAGNEVEAFRSPHEFLEYFDPSKAGCAVLDLSMPEMNGIEVQQALATIDPTFPIIFLTGHGDIDSGIRAMKGGAVDFLLKPVSEEVLLTAIREAMERSRAMRAGRALQLELRQRLVGLTPREREVLTHVIAGRLNKQIAVDLGTVEKTIKVHRASIMRKTGVNSLAELVRLTERIGIAPAG